MRKQLLALSSPSRFTLCNITGVPALHVWMGGTKWTGLINTLTSKYFSSSSLCLECKYTMNFKPRPLKMTFWLWYVLASYQHIACMCTQMMFSKPVHCQIVLSRHKTPSVAVTLKSNWSLTQHLLCMYIRTNAQYCICGVNQWYSQDNSSFSHPFLETRLMLENE